MKNDRKYLISKTINDIEKMNMRHINSLSNYEYQILKREKEIEQIDLMLGINSKKRDSLKSNMNNLGFKTFYNARPRKLSLPQLNSYERMKNYQIKIKKGKSFKPKDNRDLIIEKFFSKLRHHHNIKGLNSLFNDKNIINNDNKALSLIKEDSKISIDKKISFDDYNKIQAKADILLKPKMGHSSDDLVKYIHSIQIIRQDLIKEIIDEINNAENRYNKEIPEKDTIFDTKNNNLSIYKWKNCFPLTDYQKFFLKGLKGHISEGNFNKMKNKFIEIHKKCFTPSKLIFCQKL